MTTRVEIDLNVRTASGGTYAGLEDVTGPIEVGQVVYVEESESGLWGQAWVVAIDYETRIVYLSLSWKSLTPKFCGDRNMP